MKRIEFICDRCKKLINVQLACHNEEIEKYLKPMAAAEWCSECINFFDPLINQWPRKADYTKTDLEFEKYGK